MKQPAFQDLFPDNHCFGCGPTNDRGLRIRSHWSGADESRCTFQPKPHQNAGPEGFVNGGIIATLIDCHCVCTAIADAYRREGREPESEPAIWYVTGTLTVKYLRPAPIDHPVELRAHVRPLGPKKTELRCTLTSGGVECAQGTVTAIRVPPTWRDSD